MALNIKDPDTDRLARELARVTGESITQATRRALEQALVRERARADVTTGGLELDEIIRRGRSRPILDDRPVDDVLGYDVHGLPR